MTNYILGSGLIGLLAKEILGPNWEIIPFGKSRFFSFGDPALDDNHLIYDKRISPIIEQLTNSKVSPAFYSIGMSRDGELLKDLTSGDIGAWVYRRFGNNFPSHADVYLKSHLSTPIFEIKNNELYNLLLTKYNDSILKATKLGRPTQVSNHKIHFQTTQVEYGRIVSTIPLYALGDLIGLEFECKRKPLHLIHLGSTKVDLEGLDQTLVVDNYIDFFKCSRIKKHEYLFYFDREHKTPARYLMTFIQDFDLLNGTTIPDALMFGPRHDLEFLEKKSDIFCCGSYAEWDWCVDISSCIIRLLNYTNKIIL